MNDITINWAKIKKGFPSGIHAAEDRAFLLGEEINKLLAYPDRRLKPIVYTMISSGIRAGCMGISKVEARHPLKNEKGKIVAAKIIVYPGDREEYFAFITPEAYNALKEWMDYRSAFGEQITGESWLMRDIWQTSNMKYGAKCGLQVILKKFKMQCNKSLINRAFWEQGIRRQFERGRAKT